MVALAFIFIVSFVIYSGFTLWWRFFLLKKLHRSDHNMTLDFFNQVAHRPLGLLYLIHFASCLLVAWYVPHGLGTWTQFFVFGIGSILATFVYQAVLTYPIYKRITGASWKSFRTTMLSYMRLTAALCAPFFIFQILNMTLIDSPATSVDAVEAVVFTIGRIVVLSLLTIVFSVMFMLRMIPNSPIMEEEHLNMIKKRLNQIGWDNLRLRWIDIPDFNNAFVVGFRWFSFSNQTIFVGRNLRDLLTKDEFDAVICHELGHMANGHLLQRITFALMLVFGLVFSIITSLAISMLLTFVLSHDPGTSAVIFGASLLVTLVLSYFLILSWLFRSYRRQEHEADAFAVMKLGIKLEDLETSLRKVAQKFSKEVQKKSIWHPFKTHPEIDVRIDDVRTKMSLGVAYDWNQSTLSRIWEISFRALSPRSWAIAASLFILTGLLTYTNVQQNQNYLSMVERGDLAGLSKFPFHKTHVNDRRYLIFGITPLEMAVSKSDLKMVRFLIERGADPSRSSGFTSPADIAIHDHKWEMLDYLLGKLPDPWLKSNSSRLLRLAVREDTGRALDILLAHRLHLYIEPQETENLINRVAALRSEVKIHSLRKAGLWKEPDRLPASQK